jgi:hypothetical protein
LCAGLARSLSAAQALRKTNLTTIRFEYGTKAHWLNTQSLAHGEEATARRRGRLAEPVFDVEALIA